MQSLPLPRIRLTQPRIGEHRQIGDGRQGLGGGPRTHQIRGHDAVRGEVHQHLGRTLRLRDALLIERDVRLTLESTFGVPCSAPMTPEDDPPRRGLPLFAHALPLREVSEFPGSPELP